MGKARSLLSMLLLSEGEEFIVVGEGVIEEGGEDNLVASGGGIG